MRMLWMMLSALIALMLTACGSSPQEDFAQRVGQAMKSPTSDPSVATPLVNMRRVALAAPDTADTPAITPDQLFDWAEATYPQFFPTKEKTLTWSVYQFRYYKDTDVYLAVENGKQVVALGQPTGNHLVPLGQLSSYHTIVTNYNKSYLVNFSEIPLTLAHPRELIGNFCKEGGDTLGPRWAIADLNGDRRDDFTTVYWCSANSNRLTRDPTPNTVITYLSRPDGSYSFGNVELFGNAIVDAGGMPLSFVVSDFNRDGKPDIGIGISWEDGRWQNGDFSAWLAPQTILASSTNREYTVERFAQLASSGRVAAVDNEVGGVDFVYPVSPSESAAAYRWSGSKWDKVIGYPKVNVLMRFFTHPSINRSSDLVISQSGDPNDGPASIQVLQRDGDSWRYKSKFVLPSRQIPTINWNGEIKDNAIVEINGRAVSYGTFEDSCVIDDSLINLKLILVRLTGMYIPLEWDGVSLVDQRVLRGVSILLGFEIRDGVLIRRPDIDIPLRDRFFNEYSCQDVNRDSNRDVIVHATGNNPEGTKSEPLFFFRDSSTNFIRHQLQTQPLPPQGAFGWPDSANYIRDLDGDGLLDLVYFTSGVDTKFNSLKYVAAIHFGRR